MEKSFKLRISRVIPSFPSCRSKDPSTLPEEPVPSFLRLSPTLIHVDLPPPVTRPLSRHSVSSSKRQVSTTFISPNHKYGANSSEHHRSDDRGTEPQEFKWRRDEKWHVVTKVHDDSPRQKFNSLPDTADSTEELFLPLPLPRAEKKKRRGRKKSISSSSSAIGLSTEAGGERDEVSKTLVPASKNFSTEETQLNSTKSSPNHIRSFSNDLEPICAAPRRRKKKVVKREQQRNHKSPDNMSSAPLPETESEARLSVFKKLIPCGVEGKVKESFAVVKKSEDPYKDFKRSMVEMVLEKQMFEKRELEQLLQCFLSLNSLQYQGIILQVFTEIWEAMFCRTSTLPRISRSLRRS